MSLVFFTFPKTLDDLKARLRLNTRHARVPPLEGTGFEYGFNSVYLEKVRKYWLEEYDWAKQQKMLNKYPQFKTKVNGLDIHFQRVSPSDKTVHKIVLPSCFCLDLLEYGYEDGRFSLSAHFVTILNLIILLCCAVSLWMEFEACKWPGCNQIQPKSLQECL
jgi:hypothetical protein